MIVDEPEGAWALYFDLEDDLLQEKVPPGRGVSKSSWSGRR